MNTLYSSASTRAFYDSAVHTTDQIPADAKEITKTLHQALLEGVSGQTKRIDFSCHPPVLTDLPAPTLSRLAEVERGWRDIQLRSTDDLVARHRDENELGAVNTLTQSGYAALMEYRKALRDWPASEQFPHAQHRPEPPPCVSNQTP